MSIIPYHEYPTYIPNIMSYHLRNSVWFHRDWLPFVLIVVPLMWLVAVLYISFRFENIFPEHIHHIKHDITDLSVQGERHAERESIYSNRDFQNKFNRLNIKRKTLEAFMNLEDEIIVNITDLKNGTNLAQTSNGVEEIDSRNGQIISGENSETQAKLLEFMNPFLHRYDNPDNSVLTKQTVKYQLNAPVDLLDGYQLKTNDKNVTNGENGNPVYLKTNRLNYVEKDKYEQGFKSYQFNEYVSNMISVRRSLPDYRKEECKRRIYPKQLPTVSIIICFHNEAWSTLLRTLHSAIDRAPPGIIQEVLLIDDNSDLDHLKQRLEDYVEKELPPVVSIFRSDVRLGLVKARMKAVKQSTSDVLVFLDSHVECFKGWLEPLLIPIQDESHTIVTPITEIIDLETFGLAKTTEGYIGTLNVPKMVFDWTRSPQRILASRKSPDDYYVSPTMSGGMFSISKAYFLQLGGYDENLELLGSDNLELSLKIWMCGGRIIITPCSHIGHVFRSISPNLSETQISTLTRNKARIAEVWLDEYKQYFFKAENITLEQIGDVSAQKKMKADMKCSDFAWYVKNIFPEMYIPGTGPFFGELLNEGSKDCLKAMFTVTEPPRMVPCDSYVNPWELTLMNEIRVHDICLDINAHIDVITRKCSSESTFQVFKHTNEGFILHQATRLCLTAQIGRSSASLEPCIYTIMQTWSWSSNPLYQPQ